MRTAIAAMLAFGVSAPKDAHGCDLCAVYTATETQEGRTGLRLAVGQQFAHFGTRRDSGKEVDNPGERIDSSITQLIVGYNITDRFGLQLALPIISREYRRLEGTSLVSGDEAGVGDLTLIGHFAPFRYVGNDIVFRFTAMGGLKLPSGDSSLLREELDDHDDDEPVHPDIPGRGLPGFPPLTTVDGISYSPGVDLDHTDEDDPQSGIHGHDLALGSGSVDGIVGAQIFASWKRLYINSMIQYSIRRPGDFDYEYANDLIWEIGTGLFLLLDETMLRDGVTFGAAAVFSGETKGNDKQEAKKLDDTSVTALYLGPNLTFTWGSALHFSVGADFPVLQNNSSLQIMPDYRIRGGITWRF
jgi:hypothetical protein